MRFTFALPTFNRPDLLREALASVRAQDLAADCEILICDNQGLPETAEVIRACRDDRIVHHIHSPTIPPVANWNSGLELARGEWVSILHDDDALFPGYLRAVEPHLRSDLAAVAVKSHIGPTPPPTPPAISFPTRSADYPPALFLKGSPAVFPGVMIRREVLAQTGLFDARWGPLADYEFWHRLACAGGVRLVDAVGAFYRQSETQWTATAWPDMLRKTHLLRLQIARRDVRSPRLGRWLARFFTLRNGRAYVRRYADAPIARRVRRFERMPLRWLPSGWVWRFLQAYARR